MEPARVEQLHQAGIQLHNISSRVWVQLDLAIWGHAEEEAQSESIPELPSIGAVPA